MKTFKRILSEVAPPKSGDEKHFKDKHFVQVAAHPIANASQFSGDIGGPDEEGRKKRGKKHNRPADYEEGDDVTVYEASMDLDDDELQLRKKRVKAQEIKKKIIDESEELSEISKDTLKTYLRKSYNSKNAAGDVLQKQAHKMAFRDNRTDSEKIDGAHAAKTYGKRSTGINMALRKIAKNNKKMGEDFDLSESDAHKVRDELKSSGKYKEAGEHAYHNNLGRSYGPHFGMRSSKNNAEMEYHKGYDHAEARANRAARLARNEEVELEENTIPYNIASRLNQRHMGAAEYHKKKGNYKGYAAHLNVANKIEDAMITAGTHMPVRSKRIEAASDKAFKEHPHHTNQQESTELSELSKATLGSYLKKANTSGYNSKTTNEEVELSEAFKSGSVKLNDGSSVLLKSSDADLLNKMFDELNAGNRKKMLAVAMTDKHGFEEILGFAREAM